MLLFQVMSALVSGDSSRLGEIHVADRLRRRRFEMCGGQIASIDAPRVPAVEIEKTGAILADVSGGGGQEPDRAHGIAAERLTLETLPHPQ